MPDRPVITADATFHALTLAEATDEQLSPPFPVLYTGQFAWKGRQVPVTEKHLDEMVANFNAWKATGYEPPIDVEHAHALGKDASAVGYYKELVRKGKQLLARVAWTDDAKEQIRSGKRKYFSPEFVTAGVDENGKKIGATLLSGSLVLRPHLKQLGVVAMSESARDELRSDAATLHEAADELVAAAVAERPPVAKPDDKTTDPVALAEGTEVKLGDNTITLTEEQIKLLTDGPPKPADDADTVKLTEKVTALSEDLKDTREELFNERFTAVMAQARREGRLNAKDETTTKWRERAQKMGLDEVKSLLADIPAETIAMSERGHGTDAPLTEPHDTPDETDPQAYAIHMRALALAEEKNIDYEEAAHIAFSEAQSE